MKRTDILWGLALSLIVGLAVSPFASSAPDGLEKVAAEKGFSDQARSEHVVPALLPDYTLGGNSKLNAKVQTGIAGFGGTLALYLLGCALARSLARKNRVPSDNPSSSPDHGI
ncbi:MAG: PDGLE domain-containing protein [bacterium]